MKPTIIIFITLTFMVLLTSVILAQPGLPGGGGGPSLPGAPSQAPIDGGLGLLAAAGGSYALKKLRDRKRAEADEE